jgi:hypothetical protein
MSEPTSRIDCTMLDRVTVTTGAQKTVFARGSECHLHAAEQIALLQQEIDRLRNRLKAADQLAFTVATAIRGGQIRTRSRIDDVLLNYLGVGELDGPRDVPSWCDSYENQRAQEALDDDT